MCAARFLFNINSLVKSFFTGKYQALRAAGVHGVPAPLLKSFSDGTRGPKGPARKPDFHDFRDAKAGHPVPVLHR